MNIEDLVKEEATKLISALKGQIDDPVQKAAIMRMTTDLAMVPIRMARGEDMTRLFRSLQAEAALRGVSASLKAQSIVQDAWMNIIVKILTTALAA
jgi:hypothetical protein